MIDLTTINFSHLPLTPVEAVAISEFYGNRFCRLVVHCVRKEFLWALLNVFSFVSDPEFYYYKRKKAFSLYIYTWFVSKPLMPTL